MLHSDVENVIDTGGIGEISGFCDNSNTPDILAIIEILALLTIYIPVTVRDISNFSQTEDTSIISTINT